MPVSVVPLTLMNMGIVRRKTATSQKWAFYDLIGGTNKPQLRAVGPRKMLDGIVAKYDKVTSDDAKAKWRGQMANLGVPDGRVPTTCTPSPFLYPVHLAIARKNGTERVEAIDAYRSRVDADLAHELSKAITWVGELLAI